MFAQFKELLIRRSATTFILVLVLLILFQSCTVYRNASVDVETAINDGAKVVVVLKDGEKLKFKKLRESDQSLEGLVKNNKTRTYLEKLGFNYEQYKNLRYYNIDALEIDRIYPKDKTVSTIVTVAISIVTLCAILLSIAVISFSSSWS